LRQALNKTKKDVGIPFGAAIASKRRNVRRANVECNGLAVCDLERWLSSIGTTRRDYLNATQRCDRPGFSVSTHAAKVSVNQNGTTQSFLTEIAELDLGCTATYS
jgi:hypothetical protein